MAFSDPVATATSGKQIVDGLLWGNQWSDGSPAATSLAVYVAGRSGSENFDFGGFPVTAFTDPEETAAFRLAMELFADVCNIDFVEVSSKSQADIIVGAVNNADAEGNLGIAVPPGEDTGPLHNQQGAVIINYKKYAAPGYASLEQGGYDFSTVIHEFGHAIGLKHPHDKGGGTFQRFPGVKKSYGDFGDFDLNQGIYTMMSYNDGFPAGPLGVQHSDDLPEYGWAGTPMAIDIAAMQHMYGANTTSHTGDDVYTLPSVNAAGTFYSCIWDAGGSDTIMAGSAVDSTIDLREATLETGIGGGGFLSAHDGIFGGLTIANGAFIENATGRGGADKLSGNDVANTLDGRGGEDKLIGRNGDDTLLGKGGADLLRGGSGADLMDGGSGADQFSYTRFQDSRKGNSDHIVGFNTGADHIDLSAIDANRLTAGINEVFGFIGANEFGGIAGELRVAGNGAGTLTYLEGDLNGDGKAEFRIILEGSINLGAGDLVL